MEKELPDEPRQDDVGAEEAPAVVLPSPNTQGVTGGLQGVASTPPAVTPQPFVSPLSQDGDALAARIEAALSEDGRFATLVSNLGIATDGGTVHLSGPVPSEGQRQSLVAAVRSIPGVAAVEDALHIV